VRDKWQRIEDGRFPLALPPGRYAIEVRPAGSAAPGRSELLVPGPPATVACEPLVEVEGVLNPPRAKVAILWNGRRRAVTGEGRSFRVAVPRSTPLGSASR